CSTGSSDATHVAHQLADLWQQQTIDVTGQRSGLLSVGVVTVNPAHYAAIRREAEEVGAASQRGERRPVRPGVVAELLGDTFHVELVRQVIPRAVDLEAAHVLPGRTRFAALGLGPQRAVRFHRQRGVTLDDIAVARRQLYAQAFCNVVEGSVVWRTLSWTLDSEIGLHVEHRFPERIRRQMLAVPRGHHGHAIEALTAPVELQLHDATGQVVAQVSAAVASARLGGLAEPLARILEGLAEAGAEGQLPFVAALEALPTAAI